MIIVKPSVELLWITKNPEQEIERAGRTCYKSEDKITEMSAKGFVRGLREAGHHAMLEHATASFRIITDRGISHEIVRHRIASYAQESTRYCNYSKDRFQNSCSFIQPPGLTEKTLMMWKESCIIAERYYFALLEEGIPPQIARAVLPNCLKTEIIFTANLREFRHFIMLRGSSTAHPQIRSIAYAIWDILIVRAFSVFSDLYPEKISITGEKDEI